MTLSRLTLTAKLTAINLLLVASLMAVLAVAWHILPADHLAADGVVQISRAQRSNQNADMLHDALHAGVLRALLTGQVPGSDAQAVQAGLSQDIAEFRAELRALGAMPLPAALQVQLIGVRDAANAYVAQVERMARLAQVDRPQALATLVDFEHSFGAAKTSLARQTDALARAMEVADQRTREATDRARIGLVLAALMAVLVGLGCVALIGQSIRSSLTALRDVARDVADGNLGRRSDRPGHDEVGQLAHSINQMAANLQEMIDQMRDEAERGSFRAELAQALDMADTEQQAFEAVARAMWQISSLHAMELLVADSSDANLERSAEHPTMGAPGCGVQSPYACVAVRGGHAMKFPQADALNACPRLRERSSCHASAVCVPVSFMGRAMGVLHVTGDAGQAISDSTFDRISTLGAQVGGRIGTVRAFERTQLQASTDPLTGLANRRTLEKRMRDLNRRREAFALVLCDLDHFKRLNDTFGHPAGDEALRIFSDVVRASVRDADLPARWGGEEFAFVLAGMSAEDGMAWTQRVRDRLAQTLGQRSTPGFTASFGVAEADASASPEQLVRLADEALYRAKREGRDRSVVAARHLLGGSLPLLRTSEHKAAVDMRLMIEPH